MATIGKEPLRGKTLFDQPLIAFPSIDDERLMEMSMKLSEDFTKKLGFSEEGEEIRKLERSWSKLEDSIGRGSRRGRRVLVCLCKRRRISRSPFRSNDGVSETDDEEINRPRLRKVLVESHIPTEKSPDDIRISKGNNDDLVEVIMIFSKVQIFSPSFALYSTSKSLVIVRLREDVLGDRGSVSARNPPPARSDHAGFTLPPVVSSVPEYALTRDRGKQLGMVSSDRFYGYESSFPARDHGLVSVGSILIWRFASPRFGFGPAPFYSVLSQNTYVSNNERADADVMKRQNKRETIEMCAEQELARLVSILRGRCFKMHWEAKDQMLRWTTWSPKNLN
ncbi:hypothetical protein HID58_013758 [Brassica napus]|uniref:Uncharacterized protein n=1 Tax=Brassica napus TaxID=3708 RepID=A0ABQ7XH25_BRANA|nr:hypothetical protein HID58_013758 [Brassica napus]